MRLWRILLPMPLVTGQDWQLPELQARYFGFFSWYLQRRIDSRSSEQPRIGSE